jgi:ABC-type transport system involved in multi-copper enzyme maturation permease subunit
MTKVIVAALVALAALGLAYAAGAATRPDEMPGRPVARASALRRMGAALLASLTGVLVGVVPFLLIAQLAPPEVGATVLVLVWFLGGSTLCFLVFPALVLISRPVPQALAQRLGLSACALGLAGAAGLEFLMGNSRLAILALVLPPTLWVAWRAYRRILQPGPRRQ